MSPVKILILLSVFYVLAGACNTIFIKHIVHQTSLNLKFSHGWFLNLIMFIGESTGIPVFYILFYKKEKSDNLKTENSNENKDEKEEKKNEKEENKIEKEEKKDVKEENKIEEEEKKEENKDVKEEKKVEEEENKDVKEENKVEEDENKDVKEENKVEEEDIKDEKEEKKDEKEEKKDEKEENKDEKEENKDEEEEKPEINKFLLAIPGFLDTCSTGIANIGLILLPASIFQMLKGSIIVMTFLMSKFIIKNKHILDHYIAVPISTLGVFLVGLSAYLNADENENTESSSASAGETLLGISLMIISMFILSIQFCFDEHFMRKYSCHPLICIGYEGVFGFFINLFLCILFYFIKCGTYDIREQAPYFVKNMCTRSGVEENVWRPEDIIFAFKQLFDSGVLMTIVPITIFFMASFNILGVSITKYGSATTRAITDNVRSFLVWLYFLMPYNPEDLRETFHFLQLFGFICICLGAFIYNGIFKLEERINKSKPINLDEEFKKDDEAKLIESHKNTNDIQNI